MRPDENPATRPRTPRRVLLFPARPHAPATGTDNGPVEPISSSAAGVFRTTPGASNSEGAGLLRDGRIVQAEVLSQRADGTLVLAVGRYTVPAESELRLDVGARFVARVEADGADVVLRYLVEPTGDGGELLRALRAVVGGGRPLGELLFEAAEALRAAAERRELPPALTHLRTALLAQVFDPAHGGEGLRARLFAAGLAHEATLAAVLAGRAGRPELERARADLKALLLLGLDAAEGEPAVREALARALDGLESEQLVNLARERSGEALVFSFPFADGERWATARLLLPERRAREEEDEERTRSVRLTLGIELSALGPVRADLTLTPATLFVRVTLVHPEVLARMEAARALLARALAGQGRAVELQLRLGTREEAEQGLRPLDARYLQDHHLMSIDG